MRGFFVLFSNLKEMSGDVRLWVVSSRVWALSHLNNDTNSPFKWSHLLQEKMQVIVCGGVRVWRLTPCDKVRRVSLSDWQGDCRAQRQGSVFVARAVVRNLCFLGGSGGLGALSGSGEERGRREAANSEISKRKKKRRGAMRTPHLSQPVGCHSKGERSDQTCTRCPVSVIDRNTREMKRKSNIYKSDFKHTFSLLLTSWVTFFFL